MEESDRKEQLSIAYVHAVAACAGISLERTSMDRDSVDVSFRAWGPNYPRRPMLDAQLKCTSAYQMGESELSFPLPVKNFDDLRAKRTIPIILIVLVVPERLEEWLAHNGDEMLVRRCAYWTSLAGEVATENRKTVNVRVPRSNRFDVEALQSLLGHKPMGSDT